MSLKGNFCREFSRGMYEDMFSDFISDLLYTRSSDPAQTTSVFFTENPDRTKLTEIAEYIVEQAMAMSDKASTKNILYDTVYVILDTVYSKVNKV